MNEEEIRWIVNNLFIGNKLSQGEARLGPGRYFDLKSIKQPIIVFASMGDNITPPQQAFNWISDIYSSTEEIKANGQTIVGLIHQDVGHLGIFVSGKVAKKEHAQIVSVLKYIQQLPPGLYGMEIHETTGADGTVEYDVTLHERKLEDLKRLQKYDRVDEKPFEAVAALSELTERAYALLVRPPCARRRRNGWRRCCANCIRCGCSAGGSPIAIRCWRPLPHVAAMARALSAAARRRTMPASRRAAVLGIRQRVARSVSRYPRRDERSGILRGLRQHAVAADGRSARRDRASRRSSIRARLPAVRQVLDEIDQGGLPEAIIRTGMLIVKAGGGKHRLAQMEHTRALLAPDRHAARISTKTSCAACCTRRRSSSSSSRAREALARPTVRGGCRSAEAAIASSMSLEADAGLDARQQALLRNCASSFRSLAVAIAHAVPQGVAARSAASARCAVAQRSRQRSSSGRPMTQSLHHGTRHDESRRTRSAKSACPRIISGVRRRSARSTISRSASIASAGAAPSSAAFGVLKKCGCDRQRRARELAGGQGAR